MPDDSAIEWAQFSVSCPKCGCLERPTLLRAKSVGSVPCSNCGTTIDLNTPHAQERQREAAAEAMKRAVDQAAR